MNSRSRPARPLRSARPSPQWRASRRPPHFQPPPWAHGPDSRAPTCTSLRPHAGQHDRGERRLGGRVTGRGDRRSILPGIDQGLFLPRWLAGGSHTTRTILGLPLNAAYALTAHRARAADGDGRGQGWPAVSRAHGVGGFSTVGSGPTLRPCCPSRTAVSRPSCDAGCHRLQPAQTQHCLLCSLRGRTEPPAPRRAGSPGAQGVEGLIRGCTESGGEADSRVTWTLESR